ncbi:MAG: hypothetical protein HeimC3_41150 [Candidatus Heimdallarchaeota archaeon LC_3]|nr:MAG: hypothetical protein HeimC3_41150 [Candidatus Heimdallarchaeota archaeon LC_3]
MFESITERNERSEMLLYYADQFKEVPESIATKPFSENHKVPFCESQAYVWTENPKNDILTFYFAIENPQGISAKVIASILNKTVSGLTAKEIINISPDMVYSLFGHDLGMVRAEGLRGIVKMVKAMTQQFINKTSQNAK